jgi:3-hydroxymyristoyl/3-hydroxydecanoyl-(acyl carrier protein) dehydratase
MTHRFFWQVPLDHPALPGHFPGQPIAPGAVLLDRLDLFAKGIPELQGRPLRVAHAKFLQSAKPGDELTFVLQADDSGGFSFRIERDATVLVRGVLAAL